MSIYETELPVRDDLADAHASIVARWSRPGTHWTGAERLAIVAEVRRARAGADLPPWQAPSDVDGLVATDHPLPAAAVDAVWRLTNHPGTLTGDWYSSVVARGLDPLAYVELVGVVAQANCLDRFADGLDIARITLPEPVDGEPTGATPDGVEVRRHWVPTAAIKGPNVLKALSAVPEENVSLGILSEAQYIDAESMMGDLTSDHNALSRMQIELIAARTSKLNECFY